MIRGWRIIREGLLIEGVALRGRGVVPGRGVCDKGVIRGWRIIREGLLIEGVASRGRGVVPRRGRIR